VTETARIPRRHIAGMVFLPPIYARLVAINLPSLRCAREDELGVRFFLKFSVALSSLLAMVNKLPKKTATQRTGSEHFPSKNM
jgi:hypothetical protein